MTLQEAIVKARTESENGYVQHVNQMMFGEGYTVSDWFDGTTVASYENGQLLPGCQLPEFSNYQE